MRHGTHYGYGRGCRCDECRAAERRHERGKRRRRRERLANDRPPDRAEESVSCEPLTNPDGTLTPWGAYLTLLQIELEELDEREECRKHPAPLLNRIAQMVDEKTGEVFKFDLEHPGWEGVLSGDEIKAGKAPSAPDWRWQRGLLEVFLEARRTIVLKARQLGVTWLAGGYGLWIALYRPGTRIMVFRQKEEDASQIVNRIWDMLQSLPKHLWNGARVTAPKQGFRPYTEIELSFPDGKVSRIQGMASTETAAHGPTAALVLFDEAARIEKLRGIYSGAQPTLGSKGKTILISTGHGVSTETGEGNFFHRLWTTARSKRIETIFLPWFLHPERNGDWRDVDPEALALDARERMEQYPANEHEAFILSGEVYFDREALEEYATRVSKLLYRFDFASHSGGKARFQKSNQGRIEVYEEPAPGKYGLYADVATGRGMDYSAAYVIDLASMRLVAEFHGKLDADLYAMQLHYLGRWYNNARLAVELQGGYGEAVIIPLRDGKGDRPAYPNLYRHRQGSRVEMPIQSRYGYPITVQTRALLVNQIEKAIRERSLPELPARLLRECQTFVTRTTLPSPRAQEGCNDDCVLAAAGALELYRQYGQHPERDARRKLRHPKRKRLSARPWEPAPA